MRKIIQKAAKLLDRSPIYFQEDLRLFELNRRFLWFIVFRFAVVALFALLSAGKPFLIPSVTVSRFTFLIMSVFLLISNIIYWLHYKKAVRGNDYDSCLKKVSSNVQVQIVLDFMVLGFLIYRLGGIESPLVFFFMFHNVISCLFFDKKVSLGHTFLSLGIIFLVSLLTPHHFMFEPAAKLFFGNRLVYFYYLAGISAVYIVVWFFAANITDSLKIHENSLQAKIDELIEMDKEKTRVMLVTTHELKAPFSSIQSYVNVVLGGYAGEVPLKLKEILFKIKARCEMLMRMITEMIQLANITSLKERKDEVVMSDVDVDALLAKAAAHFAEQAGAKKVSIALPIGSHHFIKANQEQIEILFNNILSNAVIYCYNNSEIKIDFKKTEADEEKRLQVTVEDKGIGIKKENLEKVFLEYFRGEKASLTNKNSTGLGLTICKQIIAIHNGKIWIESEEGIGTKVFMEFICQKRYS